MHFNHRLFFCFVILSNAFAMEPDKRNHTVAGALIGSATYTAARGFTDNKWSAFALGVVAAAAAGATKEWIYDRARPESHTVDPRDFWFTAAGGALGSGLAAGADIAIGIGRDSYSLSMSWRF